MACLSKVYTEVTGMTDNPKLIDQLSPFYDVYQLELHTPFRITLLVPLLGQVHVIQLDSATYNTHFHPHIMLLAKIALKVAF